MDDNIRNMDRQALQDEVVRLNKIITALMDRAEQGSAFQDTDFNLFQTAIMLEDQVKLRTAELERALHENEAINRALRESETRFRSLVNQSMIGIAIIERGVVVYTNEKFNAIFELDTLQARKLEIAELLEADERPSLAAAVQRLQHGKSRSEACVMRGRRSDGTAIDIEMHGSMMDTGETSAVIILVNDVTERTRSARQIELLLREQHAILNSHVVGFVKLKDRRFVWINAAVSETIGYTNEELQGQSTRLIFVDEQSYEDFGREAYPVMKSGEIYRAEIQCRRKDGSIGWFRIDGESLFPDSDESIWAISDISERKQTLDELERHRNHLEEMVCSRTWELAEARDAAEAASIAKSTFLAHMSHELRTPLNGIMGMTTLALRSATDPVQIDQLNKSVKATRHLFSIINDILDLSRIESGRMSLEPKQFSLIQTMTDTLRMHEEHAKGKGLGITLNIAPDIPDQLYGDDLRLKQMVINFIDNAIKFSDHGTIRIDVKAVASEKPRFLIRIEVSDEGIGLTEEQQTRLFRPFSQVELPNMRKSGGTGLGLSITKRLAQLMDGDVGVSSIPGKGSTFWLTAHLERARPSSAPKLAATGTTTERLLAQRYRGERILIAEDDPLNQEVATTLLESVGLVPVIACNGRQAVELARNQRFALILMDIQMPEMDGLQASLLIRGEAEMVSVPIIAMTANAFEEDKQLCLDAGMDDHLAKPLEPDVLLEKVFYWLEDQQQRTQKPKSPL